MVLQNGASTGASFVVDYQVKHQMIGILNKAIYCPNNVVLLVKQNTSKRFPEGQVKILPVHVPYSRFFTRGF